MLDSVTIKAYKFNKQLAIKNLGNTRSTKLHHASGSNLEKGKYKNLRVNIADDFIIINGSLPKFLIGNNFQNLSRNEIVQALLMLADITGFSLDQAIITSLEFGANIQLDLAVKLYLDCLDSYPRAKKITYDQEGVIFSTTRWSITFYDKIKEMKKAAYKYYDELEDINVLRYEMKLKRNIQKILGLTGPLTAAKVCQQEMFAKLTDYWLEKYKKISKTRMLRRNVSTDFSSTKALNNGLKAKGLEALGGVRAVKGLIEDEYRNKKINKVQKKRLLDSIRNLENDNTFYMDYIYILELDDKIEKMAREIKEYVNM